MLKFGTLFENLHFLGPLLEPKLSGS